MTDETTPPTEEDTETSAVEDEIQGHIVDLDHWIREAATLSVSRSRANVVERFARDCETLKTDMDKSDTPSAHDMVDFSDRRNSLEIQFHHLTKSHRTDG